MALHINDDSMSLEINGAAVQSSRPSGQPVAGDWLAQAPDPQRGNHGPGAR